MIVIIIVNIIAISAALYAGRERNTYYLLFSFLILAVFLSYRYDFGNDYAAYFDMFYDIKGGNKKYYEIGWVLLNSLFPNFYLMIFFTSFIFCVVYYWLIVKYSIPRYWWFSVFLLVFNTNLMLTQASTMRQTMAILIFICSFKYLLARRFFPYMAFCVCAFLFHSSAIVLIPAYFFVRFNLQSKKVYNILTVSVFILLCFLGNTFTTLFKDISVLFFQARYTHHFEDSNQMGLINFIIFTGLLCFLLFYDKNQDRTVKMFNRLTILGLFSFALANALPMSARLGYYFFPATLISYPYLLKSMTFLKSRGILVMMIIVILYRFYNITQSDIWKQKFSTYKTIFYDQW